jgi:hypothetical protein
MEHQEIFDKEGWNFFSGSSFHKLTLQFFFCFRISLRGLEHFVQHAFHIGLFFGRSNIIFPQYEGLQVQPNALPPWPDLFPPGGILIQN